jgi:hypothetical protein
MLKYIHFLRNYMNYSIFGEMESEKIIHYYLSQGQNN